MILKKKARRKAKSETITLKSKSKSDIFNNKPIEFEPLIIKAHSIVVKFEEKEKNYLDVALHMFQKIGNDYGLARVSLAIAIRHIDHGFISDDQS